MKTFHRWIIFHHGLWVTVLTVLPQIRGKLLPLWVWFVRLLSRLNSKVILLFYFVWTFFVPSKCIDFFIPKLFQQVFYKWPIIFSIFFFLLISTSYIIWKYVLTFGSVLILFLSFSEFFFFVRNLTSITDFDLDALPS